MKHTLKKDIEKILSDTADIVKHFSGKNIAYWWKWFSRKIFC